MEPENQKLSVHQGLTELEQMKRTMFRTVMRRGFLIVSVLLFAYFAFSVYLALVRGH